MTPREVVGLVAYVSQLAPAQRIDEFTADAWADVLDDVSAADAKLAVREVVRRQPFVGVNDIVTGVRRIRAARLAAAGDGGWVPDCDPDDDVTYRRLLLERARALGDGAPPVPALPPGPRRAAIEAAAGALLRRPEPARTLQAPSVTNRTPRAAALLRAAAERVDRPPITDEARREAQAALDSAALAAGT